MNGALLRVWGFKYTKWFKALILCLIYPLSYGKEFLRGFINKKQDYRRKNRDEEIEVQNE